MLEQEKVTVKELFCKFLHFVLVTERKAMYLGHAKFILWSMDSDRPNLVQAVSVLFFNLNIFLSLNFFASGCM